MSEEHAIKIFFSGMEKLGPGGNEHTRRVLRLLPGLTSGVTVDAGCGTGRQTLVLAKELRSVIHAVDIYPFFLDELLDRAKRAGVAHLIRVHCMDMQDIPNSFPRIDLVWSEGAAYNIGFVNALKTWATAVVPGGFAVVSELCWMKQSAPSEVRDFFASLYPGMQSFQQNIAALSEMGYKLLATYPVPREEWVKGYYDLLEPRARDFLNHPDAAVRRLAREMLREIEVSNLSQDSYGYNFFVLQRC